MKTIKEKCLATFFEKVFIVHRISKQKFRNACRHNHHKKKSRKTSQRERGFLTEWVDMECPVYITFAAPHHSFIQIIFCLFKLHIFCISKEASVNYIRLNVIEVNAVLISE